jgi:hypothetical protein
MSQRPFISKNGLFVRVKKVLPRKIFAPGVPRLHELAADNYNHRPFIALNI